MNNATIDIVLTGDLAENTSVEQACAAIEKMFKISSEQAQQLLKTTPRVVKSGLDADTAARYQQTIEKAGLRVALRATAPIVPLAVVAGMGSGEVDANANVAPPVAVVSDAPAAAVPAPIAPVLVQAASFDGLSFRIDGAPDFSFLTVKLPTGQTLKVEASAMATMDTNLVMKTKMKGGLSRMLTGESIFVNEFTAEGGPGEIGIAPGTPGDLVHRYLRGETLYLQNSAFVACSPEVTIETKWQGLTKGFFSGEKLFLIRASGMGDLWFNSYGAIIEIDVKDGYVVDTGNIVAFTEGLEYSISKVGGYKSLFFSGEGFVCRFTGAGKIWIQTRSVGAFTGWAQQYRPVKSD